VKELIELLKQIKARHEAIENRPLKAMCQTDGELAHQDRAELIKMAEELKAIMDDITNCSCVTCGARNECNFWDRFSKLEGE
jgi:hypothetical protein